MNFLAGGWPAIDPLRWSRVARRANDFADVVAYLQVKGPWHLDWANIKAWCAKHQTPDLRAKTETAPLGRDLTPHGVSVMFDVMKCHHCNGALDVGLSFCPYCGVRADIDLRQVHFRDLGPAEGQKCPACSGQLGGIEFPNNPPVVIERCLSCHGMFFNPGELEAILELGTWPLVWLDPAGFERIAADFGHRREIVYRACPVCAERMSPHMFGGGSGVIVDRCGTHGLWLEAGGLRRLTEWWRVGGKLVYEQHQREKARVLYGASETPTFRKSVEPAPSWLPNEPQSPQYPEFSGWLDIVGSLLSGWLSHR